FLLITVAVYKLVMALTRRPLTAAIATFFFTIHTTNAYTTFDVSFMPELLYTFFYVAAIVAFLKYIDGGDNVAYWCSITCFVGALLSKEPAVTLPGMLFLTGLLFGRTSQNVRERAVACARSIAPHLLILAVYLIYAFGYLHVQGITADVLLKKTPEPDADHYVSILN